MSIFLFFFFSHELFINQYRTGSTQLYIHRKYILHIYVMLEAGNSNIMNIIYVHWLDKAQRR